MKRSIWALALLSVCGAALADPSVYDTGAPHTVMFNGTETYLGFSSGRLASAGFPQRWSAQPFTLTAATTITGVDLDWFILAGSEGDVVKYIIWKRTGITQAPVDGDQVATGDLGAFSAGIDDPRITGTEDWLHEYRGLNIVLPAGDYYLTQYADGGVNQDANTPWLTGGDLQNPALEQDGFFRSTAFPSPGFAFYSPGSVLPGPNMTDPLDRWNQSFQLYGLQSQTEKICATSTVIQFGSLVSGTVADTCLSDDVRMVVRNGNVFIITQSPITVEFNGGVTTILNPTEVKMTCENRVSLGGLTVRIDMRNYTTNSWEQVDQRAGTVGTDTVVTVSKTSNAGDYVGAAGEVANRYRVRDDTPAFLASWTGQVDAIYSDVTG